MSSLPRTHVDAGVDVRAVLTNENGARRHGLAGEALAAQALAAGVATITEEPSPFLCAMSYTCSFVSRMVATRWQPGPQPQHRWRSSWQRAT